MRHLLCTAAMLIAFAPATGICAEAGAAVQPMVNQFITLGTMGGPVPDPQRSQPANAIVRENRVYLVDTGDGTVEQLARAGLNLSAVRAVFLSHLHVDHIGGLAAVIGLRLQTETREVLHIYGPPGTRELVGGIVASLQPSARAGYGLPGRVWAPPQNTVSVIELHDGETIKVDDFAVKVAQNSHYDFAPGSVDERNYKSYSYRFDMPERSIVYTGDTGPSKAVEKLAQGADLLVSEMIDLDATLARVAQVNPHMPADVKASMVEHLTAHHLTTQQVGRLATAAQVKAVVVTHFAGGLSGADAVRKNVAAIKAEFAGAVTIANDLDRF